MSSVELDVLQRLPSLARVPRAQLAEALPLMVPFSLGPNEVLIQGGEIDDALLLILEGEVSILVGEPELEVARGRPGDILGETALFRPAWRRDATLRTATNCSVVLLDGARISALRSAESPVLAAMESYALASIGRRLRRVALQAPPEVLETRGAATKASIVDRVTGWLRGRSAANAARRAPTALDVLAASDNTLSPAARELLAGRFQAHAVRPEEVVVCTSDPKPPLVMVSAGLVELRDPRGGTAEQRVVGRMGPGALLNPLSLVHGHVPLARAVAMETGWVHVLPREAAQALLSSPCPAGSALRSLLYGELFVELVRRNTAWHQRERERAAA
jgi:CRP-like cAMP-binding protein